MKFRMLIVILGIICALLLSAAKCTGDKDTGKVASRENLDNGLPGCEKVGKVCRRVSICLNNGACYDYKPSEVVDCPVGAQWPQCLKKGKK